MAKVNACNNCLREADYLKQLDGFKDGVELCLECLGIWEKLEEGSYDYLDFVSTIQLNYETLKKINK